MHRLCGSSLRCSHRFPCKANSRPLPSGASLSPARRSASRADSTAPIHMHRSGLESLWTGSGRTSSPQLAACTCRRRGGVRAPPAIVPAPATRFDAEGEAGIQRSRRGLPRRRLHRVAAATRVRPAGLRPAVRPGDGHRGDRRRRCRGARRQGLHAGASGHARALSGGVPRDLDGRLRQRRACTAPPSWRPTSPASRWDAAESRRGARSRRSTRASRGSRSS